MSPFSRYFRQPSATVMGNAAIAAEGHEYILSLSAYRTEDQPWLNTTGCPVVLQSLQPLCVLTFAVIMLIVGLLSTGEGFRFCRLLDFSRFGKRVRDHANTLYRDERAP